MDQAGRRLLPDLPHRNSLPASVVLALREAFEADLRALVRQLDRAPDDEEMRPLRTERYRRAERHLDKSYGACHVRDPRIAAVAADALRFFDGDRYNLHAWCLMPNHAHVLLTMGGEWSPIKVAGSWKKFSSRRINAILGASGHFWQEEGATIG